MSDTFWMVVGSLAVAIFLAGLGELRAYVRPLLKTERAKRWYDFIEKVMCIAVRKTGQTYTDDLRKASSDGTLSAEEKEEAKKRALSSFEQNLGAMGLEEMRLFLKKERGIEGEGVHSFLYDVLEASVAAQKGTKASSSLPSASSEATPPSTGDLHGETQE